MEFGIQAYTKLTTGHTFEITGTDNDPEDAMPAGTVSIYRYKPKKRDPVSATLVKVTLNAEVAIPDGFSAHYSMPGLLPSSDSPELRRAVIELVVATHAAHLALQSHHTEIGSTQAPRPFA